MWSFTIAGSNKLGEVSVAEYDGIDHTDEQGVLNAGQEDQEMMLGVLRV